MLKQEQPDCLKSNGLVQRFMLEGFFLGRP
jgi:hypothetical protein